MNTVKSNMFVIYRGKRYQVVYKRFLGDTGLYGLQSRFAGGSIFAAKKDDCRPALTS